MKEIKQFDKVENIKRGELVKRKATAKKTFVRGDYYRESKRYELQDYDDVGSFIYVKKGTILALNWPTPDEEE
jgi:hypothetical protein